MPILVDARGLEKKLRALKDYLSSTRSKTIFNRLGSQAADLVYKRVKSGKGVNDDTSDTPSDTPLKKLSEKYINQRKKMKLGEFGRPRKSNLTKSGLMLRSIIHKATNTGFSVDIKNTSRPDSDLTNKELAEINSEKGRPFLALTVKEQKILLREYERMIRELARKFIRLS